MEANSSSSRAFRIPTEWRQPQGSSASELLTFGVRHFTVLSGCPVHWAGLLASLVSTHWMPEAALPNGDDN